MLQPADIVFIRHFPSNCLFLSKIVAYQELFSRLSVHQQRLLRLWTRKERVSRLTSCERANVHGKNWDKGNVVRRGLIEQIVEHIVQSSTNIFGNQYFSSSRQLVPDWKVNFQPWCTCIHYTPVLLSCECLKNYSHNYMRGVFSFF